MMHKENASSISSCVRLSPPDAVTSNVVMAVVHLSVMLYHNVRFQESPVALVRAVWNRVEGALDANDVDHGSVLAIHMCTFCFG